MNGTAASDPSNVNGAAASDPSNMNGAAASDPSNMNGAAASDPSNDFDHSHSESRIFPQSTSCPSRSTPATVRLSRYSPSSTP